MKLMSLIVGLLGAGLVMPAAAAITYGNNSANSLYFGASVNKVHIDMAGSPDAVAIGLYGGYYLDQNFGTEAEYIRSQKKEYDYANQSYEYVVSGYGGYGTYRYHFGDLPLYARGKIGLAVTSLDHRAQDGAYVGKSDKIGLGYGVGVGYQYQTLGVEATYSRISSDVDMLAIGGHFLF